MEQNPKKPWINKNNDKNRRFFLVITISEKQQKKISEKDKNLAIDSHTYKTCKAADLKPNAVADITLTKCRSQKVSFLLICYGQI